MGHPIPWAPGSSQGGHRQLSGKQTDCQEQKVSPDAYSPKMEIVNYNAGMPRPLPHGEMVPLPWGRHYAA